MASREALYPVRSAHPESVVIAGSFAPNGTSAVDNTSNEGPIGTVTRTGVGVFTVVLKDVWAGLLACVPGVSLNALANTDVQIGGYVAATKTLTVRVKTAGVAADIAANANNRIHLIFVFRNTTVQRKS